MTDHGEEKLAIGVRGCLIRTFDNNLMFRVYKNSDEFVDYEITNYDCEVVIIDPHAALITNTAGNFLDYTTESMQSAKK